MWNAKSTRDLPLQNISTRLDLTHRGRDAYMRD